MRKAFSFAVLLLIALCLPFTGMAQEAQVDRTELPIKGPWYPRTLYGSDRHFSRKAMNTYKIPTQGEPQRKRKPYSHW